MNTAEEYKIWTSKILDAGSRIGIKNRLLASIIIFGLPVDILLTIFFIIRKTYISDQFFLAYILCIIWLNVGPYFIWYYEQNTLATFFKRLDDLLPNQVIQRLNEKYKRFFSEKFWIFAIPWTLLFGIVAYSNGFILDAAGTFGFRDVWTWLLSIPFMWIPIITGMGSWGVVTTILLINDVVHRNIKLDPLHTDKRGGLGCIGSYAIGTTLLISSGSLFLPMALQISSSKTNVNFLSAFFIAIILLSFIYPAFITQAETRKYRNKLLEDLRKKYNGTVHEMASPRKVGRTKLECYLDAIQIRSEYNDLSSLNLYPFDISIINKLISSILFPILITFIQQIVGW